MSKQISLEEKKQRIRNNSAKWRYKHPQMARALRLLSRYKKNDKKYNRGESDLTAKWIVENIFSKPCVHCGKTGWDVIGCNRLDNTKPHTMDNVEPCCFECNNILGNPPKKVLQYSIDGKLINEYSSLKEAAIALNAKESSISRCCNNAKYYKTAYGYIWKFRPM